MNLAVGQLKISPRQSEETTCFVANLYRDGIKIGQVENTGKGEPNRYAFRTYELQREVEAWAQQQTTEFEFEKLDQIVGDLVAAEEVRMRLARLCRTKTLFRLQGDAPDEWRTLRNRFDERVRGFLHSHYGDRLETVANEVYGPR